MTIEQHNDLEAQARTLAYQTVRYELAEHEHDTPLEWEREWPRLRLTDATFGENGNGDPRVQLEISLHLDGQEVIEAELGDYDGVQAIFRGEQVGVDYVVRNAIGADLDDHSDRVDEVEAIEEALRVIFERFLAIYDGALYFAERATASVAATMFGRELAIAQQSSSEPLVSMSDIVRVLNHAYGLHAYVEQTGGGIATIYAGKISEDGKWDCLAGPGWFTVPGWAAPVASLAEFYVGADDDGDEPPAWTATVDDDALTIAAKIASFIHELDH